MPEIPNDRFQKTTLEALIALYDSVRDGILHGKYYAAYGELLDMKTELEAAGEREVAAESEGLESRKPDCWHGDIIDSNPGPCLDPISEDACKGCAVYKKGIGLSEDTECKPEK